VLWLVRDSVHALHVLDETGMTPSCADAEADLSRPHPHHASFHLASQAVGNQCENTDLDNTGNLITFAMYITRKNVNLLVNL
jgi:hypothetical protein